MFPALSCFYWMTVCLLQLIVIAVGFLVSQTGRLSAEERPQESRWGALTITLPAR